MESNEKMVSKNNFPLSDLAILCNKEFLTHGEFPDFG